MSNPTTPFSWQMPTNTDLVTDLPADFEVFGQAVATSMQDLLGGTTGQYLAKNSATDMDFVWVTDAAGDITGVTAGTGISGGGTSGTVTVTNSMATAFTTSGDLIQATGSGTFARLGTGTNGQYLTTNGTTNSWASVSAGGLTLLSTTTLSGATTTISSISGSYTNLLILVDGVNNNNNNGDYGILPNNASSSCFGNQLLDDVPSTFGYTALPLTMGSSTGASSTNRNWAINIYNYASSTQQKTFSVNGYNRTKACWGNGTFQSTTAISSLVFTGFGTGSFTAGTVLLYGVK